WRPSRPSSWSPSWRASRPTTPSAPGASTGKGPRRDRPQRRAARARRRDDRRAAGRPRGRGARSRCRRRRQRGDRPQGRMAVPPRRHGRPRRGAVRHAGRVTMSTDQIPITDTPFEIAGRTLRSRLILGTGGFPRLETLADAIRATRAELVTIALRRIDPTARGSLVDVLEDCGVELLPNTAGCFTARDAVVTARLAREA